MDKSICTVNIHKNHQSIYTKVLTQINEAFSRQKRFCGQTSFPENKKNFKRSLAMKCVKYIVQCKN